MARYYKFGNGWVQETVEGGRLVRRMFVSDPRVDPDAQLDQIIEFRSLDPESPSRTGWVGPDGRVTWDTWGD